MKKSILLPLVGASVMLLSACCGNKSTQNLTSTSWQVVEINSKKVTAADNSYTLTFSEAKKQVFGRGECNNYFASYSQEEKKLSLTNGGATKMMCPNQQQEDEYINALNAVETYNIDGETLKLEQGGTAKLVFKAIPLIDVNK